MLQVQMQYHAAGAGAVPCCRCRCGTMLQVQVRYHAAGTGAEPCCRCRCGTMLQMQVRCRAGAVPCCRCDGRNLDVSMWGFWEEEEIDYRATRRSESARYGKTPAFAPEILKKAGSGAPAPAECYDKLQ